MRLVILLIFTFIALGNPISSFCQQLQQKERPRRSDQSEPIAILSIIPAEGEPGRSVTLYGSGFTGKTVAFLANTEIPTRVIGPKQLTFDIPNLPAGLYALFLRREDGTASKIYNFTLLPSKPVAFSLSPDRIFACSTGRDREVTIVGKNFQQGSQVLFDGAAIKRTLNSSESLTFPVPQVQGGMHQVQVKNPEDTVSTILALFIEARPEIDSIDQGSEHVNNYELIIQGKNFQPGASLLVEGKRIPVGTPNVLDRDNAVYLDCTRIVYNRFPYDPTAKNFQIQLINPSGEASSPAQVTAP